MARKIRRREFLGTVGAAGAGLLVPASSAFGYAQNDKLRIGAIGAGGRAEGDIDGVKGENIVALCDVDQQRLDKKGSQFPSAKKYTDYRKLIEECAKEIDAVVVATPDHNHAPACAMAIKLGKHAYVEKPMTHSVFEARTLRELAAKHKVATQMGNQGTASGGLRRGVEAIQAGAIGTIKEIHLWTNRPVWPQAPNIMERPPSKKPPDSLNWDCWIGPAPFREFHDNLHAFSRRGWSGRATCSEEKARSPRLCWMRKRAISRWTAGSLYSCFTRLSRTRYPARKLARSWGASAETTSGFFIELYGGTPAARSGGC